MAKFEGKWDAKRNAVEEEEIWTGLKEGGKAYLKTVLPSFKMQFESRTLLSGRSLCKLSKSVQYPSSTLLLVETLKRIATLDANI